MAVPASWVPGAAMVHTICPSARCRAHHVQWRNMMCSAQLAHVGALGSLVTPSDGDNACRVPTGPPSAGRAGLPGLLCSLVCHPGSCPSSLRASQRPPPRPAPIRAVGSPSSSYSAASAPFTMLASASRMVRLSCTAQADRSTLRNEHRSPGSQQGEARNDSARPAARPRQLPGCAP